VTRFRLDGSQSRGRGSNFTTKDTKFQSAGSGSRIKGGSQETRNRIHGFLVSELIIDHKDMKVMINPAFS